MKDTSEIKYVFFGSSRFSVLVLDEMKKAGILPIAVVTTPDKPQGRKMIVTPTEVKVWAQKRNIPVYDAEKLDDTFADNLTKLNCDLFVVASYGKIIPAKIIDIPKHKTLNIHPSLLPKYRGASPLQSAVLDDAKDTGITIMRIDEKMDHGPIVAQEKVHIDEWPVYEEFEEMMARVGGKLLAQTIPKWIVGNIKESEQNHDEASYTKKIIKEDGLIDLSADPYLNFRKIQAYHVWPQAYFTIEHNGKSMKVKVTLASFENGKLKISRVLPEGGKEMSYDDFVRGYRFNAPTTATL